MCTGDCLRLLGPCLRVEQRGCVCVLARLEVLHFVQFGRCDMENVGPNVDGYNGHNLLFGWPHCDRLWPHCGWFREQEVDLKHKGS